MSSSPVYAADGRLVGAVAYGLTFGSSPIAGITPAEEMYNLLDGGGASSAVAGKVDLPPAVEDRIIATGAATEAEVAGGLSQLAVPLGISGLPSARVDDITRLGHQIRGTKVFAAGTASGKLVPAPLVAGGNVAAALSYGDLSAMGIGTVTAVCGDEALLFGHPFDFTGKTSLTAHRATALFVQPDNLGVPFKVANPGGIVGTVDEDRLAGLHTTVGVVPDVGTIKSTFSAVGGLSRTSSTRVAAPGFLPTAAAYHILFNLDRVNDRIGPGTATLDWVARGTRANGDPWTLRVHDMVASEFDAAFLPADEVWFALERLHGNPWEEITIDRVGLEGVTTDTYKDGTIVGIQMLMPSGRWRNVDADHRLQLVAGTDVYMRAVLRAFRSTRTSTVQFTVRVPNLRDGRGSLLVVGGGEFFFGGGGRASDFDGLLDVIRNEPTGDRLVVRLNVRTDERAVRRDISARSHVYTLGVEQIPVAIVAPAG